MAKHKLNAQRLATAPAGRYCDGGNLWAIKDSQTVGRFVYRYQLRGERHSLGLGSMTAFSLKEAREEAHRLYKLQKRGVDPLAVKRADATQQKLEAAKALTFEACAVQYIEANRAAWSNAKHIQQWQNSLAQWVYPVIGGYPVQSIDTTLVLKVLEQKVDGSGTFWEKRSETASRVRGRIESILGWAATRGYRATANPAQWRSHLEHSLPHLTKARAVEHHPALPFIELPAFTAFLRQQTDVAARALEFAILTAARSSEVLGMPWSEVDLDARLIVIPANRMKNKREHRVPIASRTLEILREMWGDGDKAADALVFPGACGRRLSDMALRLVVKRLGKDVTPHGFRSSFRDWVSECTDYPSEAAELALAHEVGSKVELSYRRGDLLKRRYSLAADWNAFVCGSARAAHHAAA